MVASQYYPLVSVIIPVYNGSNYLAEAIESVFCQTYQNLELIVVDDGSQDTTWSIIQSYGKKVTGIRKENGGVASALNEGIRQAKGEWIAWLSHDDLFLPKKIARQVNFLFDHPEYSGCYTDFEIIDPSGAHISEVHAGWVPAESLPRAFLKNMHINGSTTLIRKECYQQAGLFDEALVNIQDLDMWLRISEISELGYLPENTVRFRSHSEQGSLDFGLQLEEEQDYLSTALTNHGPDYFFPDIQAISYLPLRETTGINRVAGELWRSRHWYAYALKLYRQSLQIYPQIATRLNIIWLRFWIAIVGNEREAVSLIRRARFTLVFGDRLTGRQLSGRMLKKYPLRVDALLIWLATWIPQPALRLARQIKRSI